MLSILPRRAVAYAAAYLQDRPLIDWVLGDMGDAIYVRRGEADLDALERGITVLRSGGMLGVCPEGTRSKTGGLGTGHTGVAYLAMHAGVPIVPVAVWGQEKVRSTWKRFRRSPVTVRFGPPIHLTAADGGAADLQRHTEQVMQAIAALLPPEYRGVYAG
jgi:1-acyl-sn-glycerol-3-phosphate acyltransferase